MRGHSSGGGGGGGGGNDTSSVNVSASGVDGVSNENGPIAPSTVSTATVVTPVGARNRALVRGLRHAPSPAASTIETSTITTSE